MDENKTPDGSDSGKREQDLQQQLKNALDGMLASIDMSEFDEYDDDDETPSDEKGREKNEGIHDADEPALGVDADISQHGNGNGSETLGGGYKGKHVDAAGTLAESMRKDDEKEHSRIPNNPSSKPVCGSEESSFLSDIVLSAAKWLIGIIAFFIVFTIALNLFSASMHSFTDLPTSRTSSTLTDQSEPSGSSSEQDENIRGEEGQILLGQPLLEGYLLPSTTGHYVEPIGENRIAFQIVALDGNVYAVETCPCSYGEHDGLSESLAEKYGRNGKILDGVSFFKSEGVEAPYAKIWVTYGYNTIDGRYNQVDAVFSQIRMGQEDMDYLKENLVADSSIAHGSGNVTHLGRSDSETSEWVLMQGAEERKVVKTRTA